MTESKEVEKMPAWGLPALSWLVSIYFLVSFASNAGFPPDRKLLTGDTLYVCLWLFFLFLPFFSKIKIGKILELEREVEKAKEELNSFKAEIRSTLSVLSTNVNTIGGMSNHVTVNIPHASKMREAREEIELKSPSQAKQEAERVEKLIVRQSDEDTTLALVRTRIDIERMLRKIMGKRMTWEGGEDEIKYMGIRQLFELFISKNERLSYLRTPFRYVTQTCNAAIHAQKVSNEQAQEALTLGAQIIAVLEESEGNA